MYIVADQKRLEHGYDTDLDLAYYEWLNESMPGYKGIWTCSYRNHVPYIDVFWCMLIPEECGELKKQLISGELLKRFLGDNSYVPTDMYMDASNNDVYWHLNFQGAIIKREKLDNFLAKIKKSKDPIDFYYRDRDRPPYRTNSYDIEPIAEDGNMLMTMRLDVHDPYAKTGRDVYLLNVAEHIQMRLCGEYRPVDYIVAHGQSQWEGKALLIDWWNEGDVDDDFDKISSSGSLIRLRRDLLLTMLRSEDAVLLIDWTISIEKRDDRRMYQDTVSKDTLTKKRGIAVISSSGTLQNHDIK